MCQSDMNKLMMLALLGALILAIVFISGCTQVPEEKKGGEGIPSKTTTTEKSTIPLPKGSSAGKIAFTSGTSVYVINQDGTGKLELAKGVSSRRAVLGWSHDGKRIFYNTGMCAIDPCGIGRYYAANFDGTGITYLGGESSYPDDLRKTRRCQKTYSLIWKTPLPCSESSPDGKMIAYIKATKSDGTTPYDGNGYVIYNLVVENNGTGGVVAKVHLGEAEEFGRFSWSPDSKNILYFVVGTGYDIGYHILNIETGKHNYIVRIKNLKVDHDYVGYDGIWVGEIPDPQWSPNGKKLLYEDQGHVYIINADGTGKITVADGQILLLPHLHPGDIYLEWSSDSKKIVYTSLSSNEKGEYNIYVVNADGTGKINLGEGADAVPSPATE